MMSKTKITVAIGTVIKSALILVSAATMTVVLLLLYASGVDKTLGRLLNALLIGLVVTTNVYLVFLRKTKIIADNGRQLDTELQYSDFAFQPSEAYCRSAQEAQSPVLR